MFARVVGAVARHPLPVLAVTLLLALGGAGLALRLEPSVGTETLVDRGSETFEATQRFRDDFGDEAVLVLVRGELTRTVLTEDLGRVLALEGCLSGNVPDNKKGLGNLPPVCREIAELDAAKVVFGPATFINTSVNLIGAEFAGRQKANQRQAQAAARGRSQAVEAPRRPARRAGAPGKRGLLCGDRAVHTAGLPDRPALRHHRDPAPGRPRLRLAARIRLGRGRGAQVALRVPVPLGERRDDHDPAQARALRRAAPRGDRPVPGSHRAEGLSPAQRGELRRDRRAGRGRGPGRRGAELDLRPARSGAAADGGHPGARVPLAPAAAAAGPRTGRRGHDVRRALAGGREPHDGVDRGAARADRPRGGLRDPVPGEVRRAAPARARTAPRGGSARSGGERPRPPRRAPAGRRSSRRASPRRSASWCCCCRRYRWCAASGRCSCSGSAWRSPARSAPASRRWCAWAEPPTACAPATVPRTRERLAAVRRHPRVESGREWLADRSWRTLGVALSRPNRVLGGGSGRGGGRPGARHPERGRLRRARARARRTCRRSRTSTSCRRRPGYRARST